MGLIDWIKSLRPQPLPEREGAQAPAAATAKEEADYATLPGGDSPHDAAAASSERAGELSD